MSYVSSLVNLLQLLYYFFISITQCGLLSSEDWILLYNPSALVAVPYEKYYRLILNYI